VEIGVSLDGRNLTVSGGNAVIYKDKEPSRLELRVTGEGWENLTWHMDGAARNEWGNAASVTVSAADYTEARHIAALTAVQGGASYSTTIPFTVTRERPADLIWTQTAHDSSLTAFDLFAWTGDGTPTESWVLEATEQGTVYFAVRKSPQTALTIKDLSGGTAVKAAPGETVDGSTADGALDIFTVTLPADAVFGEAEECRFTLEAAEPGLPEKKTVQVTVAIKPNLTGVAIFRRNEEGGLTRITTQNAAAHANSLYTTHKDGSFPAWGIDFAHVQNLSTALKWLDNYALGGTAQAWAEYLVRLEQDEAMPKTMITCRMNNYTPLAEYVRIRIRGYGGERTITHDPMDTASGSILKEGISSMSAGNGFLNIGTGGGSSANYLAVHLEKNITIDAGTWKFYPEPGGLTNIRSIVTVSHGNTLVMEAGSKLTNYTYTPGESLAYDYTAVNVFVGGSFELRGGEISNIRGYGNLILCYVTGTGVLPADAFIYYDGVFSGNTADKVAVGESYSIIFYDPDNSRFAPH
jgi:hypothetical protein